MIEKVDNKQLKKVNGDIFFEVRRMPGNAFLYVNWIGMQSLETIMMGGMQILAMLKEQTCPGILNSNREIVGPWEVAARWFGHRWAPQARELGVEYFAHVLSPGIYGQRSFQSASPLLKDHFRVKSFEDEKAAQDWLQLQLI